MAYYSDVLPGSPFRPDAGLSNDVRHLINSLNGFCALPSASQPSGLVRIQVCNLTGDTLPAGSPAAFDRTKPAVGDAVPVKHFETPAEPWGVLPATLPNRAMGDCIISGPAMVTASGSGLFALPTPEGFMLGSEGAPVLHRWNSRALIHLGAGNPEAYRGPFALSYDPQTQRLAVAPGYISRNGEFFGTAPLELTPQTGFVCVCTRLEETGSWTDPAAEIAEPGKFSYPVGRCEVTGDAVSVQSFRVPVAVFIEAGDCSEEKADAR